MRYFGHLVREMNCKTVDGWESRWKETEGKVEVVLGVGDIKMD